MSTSFIWSSGLEKKVVTESVRPQTKQIDVFCTSSLLIYWTSEQFVGHLHLTCNCRDRFYACAIFCLIPPERCVKLIAERQTAWIPMRRRVTGALFGFKLVHMLLRSWQNFLKNSFYGVQRLALYGLWGVAIIQIFHIYIHPCYSTVNVFVYAIFELYTNDNR